MANVPDPLNIRKINADQITAKQLQTSEVTGTSGGAVINASKILLGGWLLESADDGIYVTTPGGIKTKMELIDFRQVPVPSTAELLNYNPRESVQFIDIPGGPQKTPGGQIGSGNSAGGGGANGSTSTTPGVPNDAPAPGKITPGGDGVGYKEITDAARAKLPPSMNNPQFLGCLDTLAKEKNVPSDSILTVMQIESGFSNVDNPTKGAGAVNNLTQASGLNQIMPSTAKGLGYTVQQIQGMTAAEQMCGPVTSYFRHTTLPANPTTADLYMANFYPAAVGKSDDYILGNHPGMTPQGVAASNPIFKGSDNLVSVGSVKDWIKTRYPP